jgi:hypothetical protein
VFAPVAVLMRYEEIEEAIDIANGTKFGLGASVFGPSQRQCIKVAKQLECGMVSINDFGVFYLNQDLPFGGTKLSGYGRFGGPEGLRSLTLTKVIILDRWPSLLQTSIPKVLDYPMRSLVQSWQVHSHFHRRACHLISCLQGFSQWTCDPAVWWWVAKKVPRFNPACKSGEQVGGLVYIADELFRWNIPLYLGCRLRIRRPF